MTWPARGAILCASTAEGLAVFCRHLPNALPSQLAAATHVELSPLQAADAAAAVAREQRAAAVETRDDAEQSLLDLQLEVSQLHLFKQMRGLGYQQ